MATLTDRTYLPPLEDCLTGRTVILSWRLVASALEDADLARLTSPALSTFLRDGFVHELLKHPARVFEPKDLKQEFETKTSSIQTVAPGVDTIKKDALWLADAVAINQVAALRIVLIEYQTRAHSHLVLPLSTQDVANIQEAAGVGDAHASSILSLLNPASAVDAETMWCDFETEARRRERILATYLSERRSFTAAVDALVTFLLHSAPGQHKDLDSLRRALLKDAFAFDEDLDVPDRSKLLTMAPTYMNLVEDCIARAQALPAKLGESFKTEAFELDWLRTAITEAVHSLSIAFQALDLDTPYFAPHELLSEWFELMNSSLFLESILGFEVVADLAMPARSLVSAICLKMLNIDRTIQFLHDFDYPDGEEPYLLSSQTLNKIHTAVTNAVNSGVAASLPVAFAWSLIVHQMHLGYQERAERRDLLVNQRAQAGFELEFQPSASTPNRRRRNSAGSIVSLEASPYDDFLREQRLDNDIAPVEQIAMLATSRGQVYQVMSEMALCLGTTHEAAFRPAVGARARLVFQDLLKRSAYLIPYQDEPVFSLLAILATGRQYWDVTDALSASSLNQVYTDMLDDETLFTQFTMQAINRFPYEFNPFSVLCRVLAAALITNKDKADVVTGWLWRTPTLTVDWNPAWDRSYELCFEDENTNSFRLTRDVDLFGSASPARPRHLAAEERFIIPEGTLGRFVTDVGRTARLEFEHSALALLGKRLEVKAAEEICDSGMAPLDVDEQAEAVAMLATVLRAESLKSTAKGGDPEAPLKFLKEASRLLPHNKDILTVISDTIDGLVEKELLELDGPQIAVLASCLQFLHAALAVCPGRVWAYMSRCALIAGDARPGRLSRITGSLDMYAERFDLLSSAVKLFAALIDSAACSAVQRRAGSTALVSVRSAVENPWLGTSEKILSRVALAIAQAALDVYESTTTWRFRSELDRSILVRDVVGLMHKLVVHAHTLSSHLTSTLSPAAAHIISSFLTPPPSASSLRFQPLLGTLLVALITPRATLYPGQSRILAERVTSVLAFCTSLLRAADFLGQTHIPLQTHLFQSACLLARLPAANAVYRAPVLELLRALVEVAGRAANGSGEPPSLLGYLGSHAARSFISLVEGIDKPFGRVEHAVVTWRFFAAVIRNRQQWMAGCLLTGRTPREALKGGGEQKIERKVGEGSVLAAAMERLREVKSLDVQEAVAVMDFVVSAQNYWPWTIFAVRKEKEVVDALRGYVRGLKAPGMVMKTDGAAAAAFQARIAAYVAETFAMQLYHMRQMRQAEKFAGELVADLDYFLREGVMVWGYNASLHGNFARNFAKRFPGVEVDDFKRTMWLPRELGKGYYYALEVAEQMLGFDAGWGGVKQSGFRKEMETANLNLSLVEAQVSLFHAWEYLLLELTLSLLPKKENAAFARQVLQVVEQCLEANQRSQPPENIFVVLGHARAGLALTLLQRLADANQLPRDVTHLLALVSSAIHAVENPFGANDLPYFRTLLKILFVVLRAAKQGTAKPGESNVAITQQVLTILDRVVARCFRALAALVHEQQQNATDGTTTAPEDLALITAILQACLSVPGIEQCQVQVLNIMAAHDVFQVAVALFSWADRLLPANPSPASSSTSTSATNPASGDPVYGELALLFLLELSALPALAEHLACDGLLGHLAAARLAGYMRRTNVGPFAENAGAARCYAIWAKCLLPLLLNILAALGSTVAPEVAWVLNQFPNLLQSSVERIEPPGFSRPTLSLASTPPRQKFISLLEISEIHSLALLTRVLAACRAQNARDVPEVTWDGAKVLECVEYWLRGRKVLRERLVPLGPREVEWRGMVATGGVVGVAGDGGEGCENRLEEKAVGLLVGVREVLEGGLEGEGE
ncbi:uncharacterized protein CTHT_0070850 [Thermochaetoides thermophila DSM 1495]|uniref:Nucleoporin NUP188 n=3 Tax=Chaetomium thermophilum (strain DSM 1495 / CBS 144.50 / IMI 039719) TaxID=759272 RepID=NU188_CHATD|nr:hypothetical protein CTHT_0070850 [Thermochaetoides thermophila DSM 1495]G0SFH5.1 RecName: Full=Nucleoporin NUP188; AltName: Full=Nuclear pore protein NUP188 [Thermochaetoides thermophila DSM 1495]AEL00683.1 Nup188p [Thermochaetoides thermophila]EGS17740.1 hypothetical protein CTHT_0070850 [Thermochaetoides thermophila DSM 1495]